MSMLFFFSFTTSQTFEKLLLLWCALSLSLSLALALSLQVLTTHIAQCWKRASAWCDHVIRHKLPSKLSLTQLSQGLVTVQPLPQCYLCRWAVIVSFSLKLCLSIIDIGQACQYSQQQIFNDRDVFEARYFTAELKEMFNIKQLL